MNSKENIGIPKVLVGIPKKILEFQKTNLQSKAYRIQDWFTRDFQSLSKFLGVNLLSRERTLPTCQELL